MKSLCQGSATTPVFTQPATLLATQRLKQLQSFNIEFHYIKYSLVLHPHYMLYITSGCIKLGYITFNYLNLMPACFLLMVPPWQAGGNYPSVRIMKSDAEIGMVPPLAYFHSGGNYVQTTFTPVKSSISICNLPVKSLISYLGSTLV